MWKLYDGLMPTDSGSVTVLVIWTVSPFWHFSAGSRRTVGVSQFLAQFSYPWALLKVDPPSSPWAVMILARSGVSVVRASRGRVLRNVVPPVRTHIENMMELSSPLVVIGIMLVWFCSC